MTSSHLVDTDKEKDAFAVLNGLLAIAHIGIQQTQHKPHQATDANLGGAKYC